MALQNNLSFVEKRSYLASQSLHSPDGSLVKSVMDKYQLLGGSPGLVVMEDKLYSRGGGFESQHQILDEHWCVVEMVLFVWKDRK